MGYHPETMSAESQTISHRISVLLIAGRTAEARVELDRLLALDPDDPDARSVAGDVYAYTGAHSAAYKQYNLAAETFNRLGRADMALAVHHKILELDPGMLDATTQTRIRLLALLVAAEDAVVMGHNDKAVAGFQEAIRQFPNHTITYQRLASLLVRLGRVEDAAEQYLVVARAFYAHGVLDKARPYFERVLELKPDHAEGLGSLLACLRQEGKDEEGQRFVKAGVLAHLQAGRQEEAAALFESLPEAQREGPSALGAALLLQSGEVGQAERMAAGLERARPELADWFKTLGRSALERGDSVVAEAYFRWVQGGARSDAPVNPAPLPAPPWARPAQEEPARPGMSAPTGLGPPPLPPPGLGPPPPPLSSKAAPELAGSSDSASTAVAPSGEDQNILQTMGEMCLAEEMFEEAKQVFERLSRVQPENALIWELLNRSRSGLGLAPVMPARRAVVPAPAPVSWLPGLAPEPGADQASVVAVAGPDRVLGPAALVPAKPVGLPSSSIVFKPVVLPPRPAGPQRTSPRPLLAPMVGGGRIERATYTVQLGELPPAVPSDVDENDEIIE